MLKPIAIEKLEECILRLVEDINGCNNYLHLNNKIIVNKNDVMLIEKNGIYCITYLNNSKMPIHTSLDFLQKNLTNNFIRCHKSYIVNIDRVKSVDYKSLLICLDKDLTCPIGLKYKENLREVFNYGRNIANVY